MTTQASDGPIDIIGQNPPMLGTPGYTGAQPALVYSNPDLAPSFVWGGWAIRDPRYQPRIGAGALQAGGYPNQDCGWYISSGGMIVIDQAPAVVSNANIAANQRVTNGTPMTLVSVTGAGITVLSKALPMPLPLGATIPAGACGIDINAGYVADTTPAYNGGGSSGAFKFFDPMLGSARCVSVTAAAGATGGVVAVNGYDVYGQPMTQNITAVANSTVASTKAFKFVTRASPQFSDASHNYSVGTVDTFGFNVFAADWCYVFVYFNGTLQTANTGFTAGVTTTPSATTGDVRGTWALQGGSSDGAKKLQMLVMPSVANIVTSTFAAAQQGLVGPTQF